MPLDGNPEDWGSPATVEETPADLLQRDAKAFFARVADLIEEKGWTTCVLQNRDGNVCLIGAIGLALGLEINRSGRYFKRRPRSRRMIGQAAKRLGFEDISHAMTWNDHFVGGGGGGVVARLRDVR